MGRKKSDLMTKAEKFADTLLWEASGGVVGKMGRLAASNADLSIGEKRAVFDSILKLIALKNKIKDDEDDNGFLSLREALSGSNKIKS